MTRDAKGPHPSFLANWEAVIGLEVHAQLRTRTKLFCACATDFGAPPNTAVCPVCLGYPGVLPVLNRHAVTLAIRIGLATGCSIEPVSIFARKNYFYPDLPKAYQISQYDRPLCRNGALTVVVDGTETRVRIHRIHLEEDAGKSKHPERTGETESRIDLNRCGTPLVEIVTEPDLRSAGEAHAYLTALRQLVQYLDVCDGNMDEGSLRCDANVSVRKRGENRLGTRTELKNLNSFKFVEKAIQFEIERQIAHIEAGGTVVQETLLWDPTLGRTRSMRGKEDAHDYRYFPDPDLPPLRVTDAWVEEVRLSLPELPDARRVRFTEGYGLGAKEAQVLTSSRSLAEYFESTVAGGGRPLDPKLAANWIQSELLGQLNQRGLEIEDSPLEAARFADLLRAMGDGRLSGKLGKMALEEMLNGPDTIDDLMERHGWSLVSDTAELQRMIDALLEQHPEEVRAYREGKDSLFRFFVGQIMKATRGQAEPNLTQELLQRALGTPRLP